MGSGGLEDHLLNKLELTHRQGARKVNRLYRFSGSVETLTDFDCWWVWGRREECRSFSNIFLVFGI